MAKSKSFFGLRRGSTKTLTFQVNNGKQITKDRVYEVKNPRTEAQMKQRMVMATASAAYANMKEIVDHSFEGITYGQMNMSEFIKVNAKAIRDTLGGTAKFGFNAYQDRSLMIGQYIMSRGSASSVPQATVEYSGMARVSVAISSGSTGAKTASQLLSALGLSVGEMATCCFIADINGESYANQFGFVRFKAIAGGDTVVTAQNFTQFVELEGTGTVTVSDVPDQDNQSFVVFVQLKYTTASDDGTVPSTTIHSAKSANGWLRSNNSIVCPAGTDYQLDEDNAIATYPVGGSYVLNGGEVNG